MTRLAHAAFRSLALPGRPTCAERDHHHLQIRPVSGDRAMHSCWRQKGSAGMRSWWRQWLVGLFSAYRLPSHLSHEQLGRELGNPAFSEKVVPITRDFPHYLEPSPHALKRKNELSDSEFGRYRNRFHNSAAVLDEGWRPDEPERHPQERSGSQRTGIVAGELDRLATGSTRRPGP